MSGPERCNGLGTVPCAAQFACPPCCPSPAWIVVGSGARQHTEEEGAGAGVEGRGGPSLHLPVQAAESRCSRCKARHEARCQLGLGSWSRGRYRFLLEVIAESSVTRESSEVAGRTPISAHEHESVQTGCRREAKLVCEGAQGSGCPRCRSRDGCPRAFRRGGAGCVSPRAPTLCGVGREDPERV